MNMDTKYIAKYARCSLEDALLIQDKIDRDYMVDWSEASEKHINRAIDYVLNSKVLVGGILIPQRALIAVVS